MKPLDLQIKKPNPLKIGIRIFQIFLTCFIFVGMVYSLITQKEHYPFAPYTMYSYSMKASRIKVFEIFFVLKDGSEVVLEQKYVEPMDEARIKFSFEQSYWKNYEKFEIPEIDEKLKGLLSMAKPKLPDAKAIRLKILSYKGLEQVRTNQPNIDFNYEYPRGN